MKKILLLIDDLGQGGAERQIVYLSKELHAKGYSVKLVKFYPGESTYSKYLKNSGIVPEINIEGNNRWKRILEIRKLVKNWNPDLTIVYKDGTCIAACLAKIFVKYRLVVSERNTTQRITFLDRLKFTIYRLADYIVPNSYSQTSFLKKHFPALTPKLVTITNMIDVEQFSPSEIPVSQKRVIITARLSPQKNVLTFLEGLKMTNLNQGDIHFDWFGKIHSQEYYQEILQKVQDLGLDRLITFHDNGSENIQEEYRRSTHFCLPSLYEGFPNVLCEAMASGLICCASNVCDNPEILNDQFFLFDPKSPNDIARTINNMLNISEEEYKIISTRNRERIIELCSAETFTSKYLKLY